MYSEHLSEFSGLPVVEFEGPESWQGPDVCYRVRQDYEDETTTGERLQALIEQPECEDLTALIIGAWAGACEGTNSEEMVQQIVAAGPALKGLTALFLGDIVYEESELSWIQQSNISPILQAFPHLQVLWIRGGTSLSFSKTQHASLRELRIETGGLSSDVLRELSVCDFPFLERLELLLGEPNYGFDGGVENLQPLLTGERFPNLRRLGLMNAEIADDIAAFIVNTPIVKRLETLDLSMGNLSEEGVKSLMGLRAMSNLKSLNLSHHYASESAIEKLQAELPFPIIADDPQEAEEDGEWRPILHAE